MDTKSKHILVICPYPQGIAAGQRLKYEQYFDTWRQEGIAVTVNPFFSINAWPYLWSNHYLRLGLAVCIGLISRLLILITIKKYDAVYIFMWVSPVGGILYEKLYRLFSRKIIYDLEDDIPEKITNQKSINIIYKWLRSKRLKTLYLIKHSNYVINSSPELSKISRRINTYRRSKYISSSFNPDYFIPTIKSDSSTPTIGWTGTKSSMKYLDTISEIIITLSKTHNFNFKLISNFEYSIDIPNFINVKWTKSDEVEDMQSFDIGVYPLIDDGWVRGKSGLKAIQYMAFGIPSVCSNLGINSVLIENGYNGFLVSSKSEWLDSLKKLLENFHLRQQMGESARRQAVLRYSNRIISLEYLEVLHEVLSSY